MTWRWRIAFALAVGAIALGWWIGEAVQVMMNAATVCLACMGLG